MTEFSSRILAESYSDNTNHTRSIFKEEAIYEDFENCIDEEEFSPHDLEMLEKFKLAANINVIDEIIPFVLVYNNICDVDSNEIRLRVMKRVKTPSDSQLHLAVLETSSISKSIKNNEKNVAIGEDIFSIERLISETNLSKLFKISNEYSEMLTLKVCKLASAWEYFILYVINSRLSSISIPMPISCDVFLNESLLLMYCIPSYSMRNMLDIAHESDFGAFGGGIDECLAMFYILKLLKIVNNLKDCNIIHNNIKPGKF
jgi:serine/threonine protein kinase